MDYMHHIKLILLERRVPYVLLGQHLDMIQSIYEEETGGGNVEDERTTEPPYYSNWGGGQVVLVQEISPPIYSACQSARGRYERGEEVRLCLPHLAALCEKL
jgi:hypothetical protein